MGQLGTGTTETVALPKRVFADKAIQSIACGSVSTMLLDKSNDIWGCGWNEHGNLSTGTNQDTVSSLTKTVGSAIVAPPASHSDSSCCITIAAGGAHFLATKVFGVQKSKSSDK